MTDLCWPMIIACAALAAIAFAAWCSQSLRDTSRRIDTALDVLLAAGEDLAEPEIPVVVLDPAAVLAMTQGEISAILQPLDRATDWSIHPALRRKPRPRPGLTDHCDRLANEVLPGTAIDGEDPK